MSLIEVIKKSDKEIFNNIEELPSVFYIGLGRTGSTSICRGFSKNKVAHWHEEFYFEQLYNIKLNMSLLDVVNVISEYTGITPLIIESYREPISRTLSLLFQKNKPINIKNWITTEPYAKNWIKYNIDVTRFDKTKSYLWTETPKVKTLFIKYEKLYDIDQILQSKGYTYSTKYYNATNHKQYNEAKKSLKFDQNFLENLYNDRWVRCFYTDSEINSFIEKYKE